MPRAPKGGNGIAQKDVLWDGVLLEMCIDSVESAVASAEGGADRVELCANLLEGGTTPSLGLVRETRRRIDIGLAVMVRTRGGDFCPTAAEFSVMCEDVRVLREEGADCLVLGILTAEGKVDRERTGELLGLARPLEVTFHRAFDMTRDPIEALEDLIGLGVDRILTSGQETSVLEGLELIGELQACAAGRIVIMPGCGITVRNIGKVIRTTGVSEVHVAVTEGEESPMRFRNGRVFMGTALRSEEFRRCVTRREAVSDLAGKLCE